MTISCPRCFGRGEIRVGYDVYFDRDTCPRCDGRKYVVLLTVWERLLKDILV